jgi:hypothetical protein
MKVVKESEETAAWAKIAIAFVAGLVLAGVGALLVVRNLGPKAASQVTRVGPPTSDSGSDQSSMRPAQGLPAQPGKPVEEPVPAHESEAKHPARKSHPSAFGDRPAKQPVTMARNMPPAQTQDQGSPSTGEKDLKLQDTQQDHPPLRRTLCRWSLRVFSPLTRPGNQTCDRKARRRAWRDNPRQ